MAAGNALQTPIQAAYREAFQNIVIPNFERATQTMFQQINDSFAKGSKECEFLLFTCHKIGLYSIVHLIKKKYPGQIQVTFQNSLKKSKRF